MRKILFGIILCLLVSNVCNAAASEWSDKKTDFKKVKTILITEPTAKDNVQDAFAVQKVTDFLQECIKEKQSTTKKIKFITIDDLVAKLNVDAGENIIDLKKRDPEKFRLTLTVSIPTHVDAILYTDVITMGYGKGYSAGYQIPYTTHQTSYVHGNINGTPISGNVTSPQTNYISIPGGRTEIVNGGVGMYISDSLEGKTIWGVVDIRDRENAPANKTTPDAMIKRIINSGLQKLIQKIEGQ